MAGWRKALRFSAQRQLQATPATKHAFDIFHKNTTLHLWHKMQSIEAMFRCTLKFNDEALSMFKVGALALPAFSGLGTAANKRAMACTVGVGPIPPATYYIFDRQSGGLLGPLRDFFTGRDDWFALYAADGRIDDETSCDAVKRGRFRLHPKGQLGRSEGCVVIDRPADYVHLRTLLKSVRPQVVPGASLQAYGRLVVT